MSRKSRIPKKFTGKPLYKSSCFHCVIYIHDNDQNTNNVSPESVELKLKLQIADDVIANLKKEIAMKDFVSNARDDIIKKSDDKIRMLIDENKDLKTKLETKIQLQLAVLSVKVATNHFRLKLNVMNTCAQVMLRILTDA